MCLAVYMFSARAGGLAPLSSLAAFKRTWVIGLCWCWFFASHSHWWCQSEATLQKTLTLCQRKALKGFPSTISKFDGSHYFSHWRKEMCVSYTGGINAPLTFILLEEMCIFRGKTVIHSRHASETNPILFTSLKRSELCNWMPQPLYS